MLSNSKTLVNNTLALYIRMLFLMVINLYTSRVILNALGVVDYGIYNAVAGFVTVFSMLSNTLSSAVSRFFTYALGENDKEKLSVLYSTTFIILIALAVLVVIVGETIGIWFVNNKMTILESRIYSANWVFQISLFTFLVNILNIPFNALIIAYEKMRAFAYVGIVEGLLTLCVALFLRHSGNDRLVTYTLLLLFIAIVLRIIYWLYCKFKIIDFEVSRKIPNSISTIKQVLGFAGWNFFEAVAGVLRDQGINMLLNVYCGPVVNAARGLAIQVNTAVGKFSTGFMTALTPQITKTYASNNLEDSRNLVYRGSKFSFYLMYLLSAPIIIKCESILSLWLGKGSVPEHTVLFVQLILLLSLVEILSQPTRVLILATGKIKMMQILVSVAQIASFPISWILLACGIFPEITVVCVCVLSIICLLIRLQIAHLNCDVSILDYLKQVILPIIKVVIISFIPSYIISHSLNEDAIHDIFSIVFCLIICISAIILWGINRNERKVIRSFIKERVMK